MGAGWCNEMDPMERFSIFTREIKFARKSVSQRTLFKNDLDIPNRIIDRDNEGHSLRIS